jgi:hypothetical protein
MLKRRERRRSRGQYSPLDAGSFLSLGCSFAAKDYSPNAETGFR